MPNNSDPADLNQGTGYTAALESLRSAAKWLLTAFAGIAAALAAGLQLTGIGELPATSWRLWVAIVGIALALAALGFMAHSASAILTEDWVTLSAFTDQDVDSQFQDTRGLTRHRFDQVSMHIEDNRYELYGHVAPDLAALHRRLREATEQIDTSADPAARNAAVEQAAVLRTVARDVAQCANYHATLQLFRSMKVKLAWASLVAAVALGAFAYAANPPKPSDPVDVRIHPAPTTPCSTPPSATVGSKRLGVTRTNHVHDDDPAINAELTGLELTHRTVDDRVATGHQPGAKTVRRHAHRYI
ncbi:hypothetical protein [Streptomyces sp. NPDC050534]|uniref:hypothetical protein n=1 Tax=Streptomyces sp. NPDC050534 TaxID=3365625 RepID=UPI0037B6FCCA